MPRAAILFCVLLGVAAVAQQTVNPRRRPNAPVTVFAPGQYGPHDGPFTLRAGRIDRWNQFSSCHKAVIVGYLPVDGIDPGCGEDSRQRTLVYLPGWGFGHATLHAMPLPKSYEIRFTVTQGIRDS
jgi:hypothetical protein